MRRRRRGNRDNCDVWEQSSNENNGAEVFEQWTPQWVSFSIRATGRFELREGHAAFVSEILGCALQERTAIADIAGEQSYDWQSEHK